MRAVLERTLIKHGIKPLVDFKMPGRTVGDPALENGPMKGITLDTKRLFGDFLIGMGWDTETAIPTKEKLEELGLQKVAEDLYK